MELTITRPDDWHLHVRDGAALAGVVPHTAAQFGRAIIMPNLQPPVTTVAQAAAYRQRILDVLPVDTNFNPLMTLYLTDNTSPDDVRQAVDHAHIHAVKLYPAGATTHSDAGVTDMLVLSGDTHSYWANVLYDADGTSMGVELGATGITSPRSFLPFGLDGIARWDELVSAKNEEVVWAEGRYRGYVRLDITHDNVRADFVTVTDVESREYETRIVKSMDIVNTNGTLKYV